MKSRTKVIFGIAAVSILVIGTMCFLQNKSNVSNQAEKAHAISSVSLAHSYSTINDLADAAVLIAEVKIDGVANVDQKNEATFYNATIKEVLKGSQNIGDEIIITQLGIDQEGSDKVVQADNPLPNKNDDLILFLKKAENDEMGTVYYVAGEYQGKFEVEDGKVSSVNENDKKDKKYTSGKLTKNEFLEQTKEMVKKQDKK